MANTNKNKLQSLSIIFLIVSFIFLYPIQISYAAENNGESSENSPTPGSDTTVNNLCSSLAGGLNIKDSLVLSAISLCLPGILKNLQEARAIKCEYIKCYYRSVTSGRDPTVCEKQKAFDKCKYIWGEVMALPPMAIIENVRRLISNILANPTGYAWSAAATAARSYLSGKGHYNSLLDGSLATFLAYTDLMSLKKDMQEYRNNEYFPSEDTRLTTACDGVDDIAEEAEQVVEAYGENTSSGNSSN